MTIPEKKMEKILVCGLGSMGKRRIRLLQSLYPGLSIYGTDKREDRCRETGQLFSIKVDTDYDSAFAAHRPDAVFVCTSPLEHSKVVLHALENTAHTFSEINLSSNGYEKIISAAKKMNRVAFLSATFLYREEINWIIEKIRGYKKLGYRYHVGQYLPDWHPWENYKDFFAANKETSACKEIMAIEFPWIRRAFGDVKSFNVVKNKSSELDLDHEDSFYIIFEHENGICGTINIDCICVHPVRKLEVYSENLYLEWGGTPDSLKLYSDENKQMISVPFHEHIERNEDYAQFVVENPYIKEIQSFFSLTARNPESGRPYGYREDLKVIRLIEDLNR